MALFFLELLSLAAISVRLQQLSSSFSNVLAAFLLWFFCQVLSSLIIFCQVLLWDSFFSNFLAASFVRFFCQVPSSPIFTCNFCEILLSCPFFSNFLAASLVPFFCQISPSSIFGWHAWEKRKTTAPLPWSVSTLLCHFQQRKIRDCKKKTYKIVITIMPN